jgi:subtilase family serine protease
VCKRAPHGRVGCFAVRLDRIVSGRVRHADGPTGYGPPDLRSAYALPAQAATGMTVAIVDAYDDPSAEADLSVYRARFGLPACHRGCFRKVDQRGGRSLPVPDPGWAEEISLDLDMVSAVCPACRILLVEADSAAQVNLGAAVDTAVRLGADAVSNSYGGPDASDHGYGRYYHHPGVALTASTGDSGYGVAYPASSKWVTAVGGTTLTRSTRSRRGWAERAWTGSGSGCSPLNTAGWQSVGCDGRAVADVAAVADPATGVAVYDSYPFDGASGWLTFGGTSAAAPIVAGVFALAGNTSAVRDGSYVWTHHRGGFNDVRSGSNGSCDRWCTANSGWDGPTGWGTPKGLSAF